MKRNLFSIILGMALVSVLAFSGCEDSGFNGSDCNNSGQINMTVPVGTILAWHKNLTHTPTLPDGWAECDGQVISDSHSPYYGQDSPNLNGSAKSWNSKGSFLRGSSSSGEIQDDAFQGHEVELNGAHTWATDEGWQTGLHASYTHTDHYNSSLEHGRLVPNGTNGDLRTASETRPVNMSVVWIMRIK